MCVPCAGTQQGGKYSPNGTLILFNSDHENTADVYDLYVMDASDFRNVRRLTYGMNNQFSRTWSPDGTQIVFNSMSKNNASGLLVGQIYTMRSDGSQLKQLTNSNSSNVFNPGPGFPAFTGEVISNLNCRARGSHQLGCACRAWHAVWCKSTSSPCGLTSVHRLLHVPCTNIMIAWIVAERDECPVMCGMSAHSMCMPGNCATWDHCIRL